MCLLIPLIPMVYSLVLICLLKWYRGTLTPFDFLVSLMILPVYLPSNGNGVVAIDCDKPIGDLKESVLYTETCGPIVCVGVVPYCTETEHIFCN